MKYFTDLFDPSGRHYRRLEILTIADQSFDLFDDAITTVFEELKAKLDVIKTKSTELNSSLSNYVENNQGIPTPEDIEIFNEMGELGADDYWSNEHLSVLSDMKIVYLFKSVEISMKYLIQTGYPKINTKDFYHWEIMASYFKSININISDFDGYVEVTELRKVNNSIKHNNTINEDINKIREFAGEIHFTYINIGKFYKRIKPKTQNFIKILGQAIIGDLYVFDDSRVEKISDDFKLKMDKDTLNKFADKLTNGQKPKL